MDKAVFLYFQFNKYTVEYYFWLNQIPELDRAKSI